jgi:Zn-dependent peptidase ImmA (M78 family)
VKIPSTIKILGHDIETVFEDTVILDGKEVLGYADFDNNKIHIQKINIPESMQALTFLHEILHFISHLQGKKTTEEMVEFWSANLFPVIRDNNLRF